jgi:hypothetical protein
MARSYRSAVYPDQVKTIYCQLMGRPVGGFHGYASKQRIYCAPSEPDSSIHFRLPEIHSNRSKPVLLLSESTENFTGVPSSDDSGHDSLNAIQSKFRYENWLIDRAYLISTISTSLNKATAGQIQDIYIFAIYSKTALTSREGAKQIVRYASTTGSQFHL